MRGWSMSMRVGGGAPAIVVNFDTAVLGTRFVANDRASRFDNGRRLGFLSLLILRGWHGAPRNTKDKAPVFPYGVGSLSFLGVRRWAVYSLTRRSQQVICAYFAATLFLVLILLLTVVIALHRIAGSHEAVGLQALVSPRRVTAVSPAWNKISSRVLTKYRRGS